MSKLKRGPIRVPIILSVLTLITFWIAASAPGGITTIQINSNATSTGAPGEAFRFANIVTGTALSAWVTFALTALATALAWFLSFTGRKASRWLSICFGVVFVFNILISLFNRNLF